MFYNPIKEVSQEILDKLNPLGIAVWFMDDGNMYYNGNNCHLTLSVNGFSEESKDRIIKFFKDRYNINFKRNQQAIYITSVKEVKKFESNFKNYYHESMKYKTLEFQKERHERRKQDRKNLLYR